jgi:hypothetical protein
MAQVKTLRLDDDAILLELDGIELSVFIHSEGNMIRISGPQNINQKTFFISKDGWTEVPNEAGF